MQLAPGASPRAAPFDTWFLAGLAALGSAVLLGVYNALAGQDLNWDLRNYHFSSAHLLLHGDLSQHLAPSQLMSWHNPLPYVPFYLAIRHLPPAVASTLFALVPALNAPFVYLIALRVAAPLPPKLRRLAAFGCVAVGMSGAIFLAIAGTSFVDNVLSILTLAALLTALAALDPEHGPRRRAARLALAGVLMGAACGLKMTNAVFALALALALLATLALRRLPARQLAWYAAGAAAAVLLVDGWWAWGLWREYGNPIFPFFNNLFASPLAELVPLRDPRYLPSDWNDFIAYPLHWALGDLTRATEIPMRDGRYLFALGSTVVLLGTLVARWRHTSSHEHAPDALPLAVFFAAGYVVWLAMFAILRYAVVLEVLSGVIALGATIAVAQTLRSYLTAQRSMALFAALCAALIATTRAGNWERVPFDRQDRDDWFGVHGLGELHEPGTRWVLPDGEPLAYLVAFLPADARLVRVGGFGYYLNAPLRPGSALGGRAAALLADGAPLRTLHGAPLSAQAVAAISGFGLEVVAGSCRVVATGWGRTESCALRYLRAR